MDEDENIRSVNFVKNTITSLNGELHVEWNKPDGLNYIFYIHDHNIQIRFGRDVMEDFNVACQGSKKSDNYRALDNFIRFRIYIALGNAGLIPKFSVSKPLLDEERDWLKNFKTHFEVTDELNDCFYNGLKELSSFLEEISKKYGLNEEMQEELRRILGLLDHYKKEHDFKEDGVSEESLGFLKAAAVCVIIRKEREKKSITIPRILRGKDQEIYSIVAPLRENPFPQIKMPDCIHDYASHIVNFNEKENVELNAASNMSCGSLAKDACDLDVSIKQEFSERNVFLDIPYRNYEDCEESLRDLLGQFDLQPIVAKDRLTSNAVLCKVCKLIKTCKYGIADISSGSNSVSYEYGLMHGFGMKVCLLLRSASAKFTDIHGLEHVPYNGLRRFRVEVAKWLLGNVADIPQNKVEEFIEIEERKLRDEGEIPLSQIELDPQKLAQFDVILNEDRKGFGCSSGGVKNTFRDIGYHLSFRIRNRGAVNICLEEIGAKNILLGMGKLDRSNPRLSKLPFNIEPHKTEEVNLMIKFPNEVDVNKKGEDLKIELNFKFADQTITKEAVGYFQ